ncbi:MAG: phage terminase small subunit P27 family [Saprospiraceae bacterium]|nr:phage terminase small subunit P27 family [Saprospiraceae bacterium]
MLKFKQVIMKSTKPTPKEFKIQIGTYRKDRDKNKHVAKNILDSIPLAPHQFDKIQKEIWHETCQYLHSMNMLQSIGQHFIVMYCDQFKIYFSCLEMIQKDGIMILQHTRDGKVSKKHPAIGIMQGAIKNILSISDKYGLTPLALGKIKIHEPGGIVNKVGSDKWNF